MAFSAFVLDVDTRSFVTTANGNRNGRVSSGRGIVSRNVDIKTARIKLAKRAFTAGVDCILTRQQTIDSVDAAVVSFRYATSANEAKHGRVAGACQRGMHRHADHRVSFGICYESCNHSASDHPDVYIRAD